MSHPDLPGPAGPSASVTLTAERLLPERRATVLAALLTAVAVAVLGAPFGLLWAMVAPDVPIRITERGPVYGEAQPEQLIAADGWFVFLAVPLGLFAAVGAWLFARTSRGAPGLVAVTAGAVAAALVAWWLGRQVGLADYQASLAEAEAGTVLGRPADLGVAEVGWWPPRILGVLLVPALVAAATYTLLAAWSQFSSLHPDQPDLVEQFEPADPTGPGSAEPSR